jgi:tripartite-type tricarboxylate transporter receptor subunit TctC
MKRVFTLAVLTLIFGIGSSPDGIASDYPTKPIKIICPFSVGGSIDVLSRAFASVAEKYLGQPVVVSNRPGALGLIGEVEGLNAKPDGYTITTRSTMRSTTLEWEKLNGRKPPYVPEDFVNLGAFTMEPTVIVVPYNSPWNTMDDMVKACKAKPNFYRFGSGSMGTSLPGFLLMKVLDIKMRHVPYNGGGPLLAALAGGHVDFSGQWPSATLSLVRGKKLKVLAVQGEKRLKAIPDVPTTAELGIIGAEWEQGTGLSVPSKTPQDIVDKLRAVAEKVANDPAFIKIIEAGYGEVIFMDGPAMTKRNIPDTKRAAKILRELLETGDIKKD